MGNYTANASMGGQGTGGHLHRVKTLAKENYAGKYLQLRKIWLTGFRARPALKDFPEKRAGGAKVLKKQAKGEMPGVQKSFGEQRLSALYESSGESQKKEGLTSSKVERNTPSFETDG